MIYGKKARYSLAWYGVDKYDEIFILNTNPRIYVDIKRR